MITEASAASADCREADAAGAAARAASCAAGAGACSRATGAEPDTGAPVGGERRQPDERRDPDGPGRQLRRALGRGALSLLL